MSIRKDRTKTIYYKVAHAICSKYDVKDDTKYVAMVLDMMTFQIFESIVLLMIGYLLGIIMETILVMVFFIIARVGHKGIHASNRTSCTFITIVVIIGISYVSSLLSIVTAPILGYIVGMLLRDRNKAPQA